MILIYTQTNFEIRYILPILFVYSKNIVMITREEKEKRVRECTDKYLCEILNYRKKHVRQEIAEHIFDDVMTECPQRVVVSGDIIGAIRKVVIKKLLA